jgi:thiamine pyrophosphokinase
MRGIAFIGGEGPPASWSRKLAAGADLLAAADSGLEAAEAAGLRPRWIVGDMDSLDDLRRLEAYPAERVLRYPPDKDETDTELALRLLWDQGCDETWLAGGGGGRVDHLLGIRSLFERERTPDRWLTAREDIRCLREGEHFFPGPAGGGGPFPGERGEISVFPLGEGPWEAASRGLRWPLAGLNWNRGFCGLSNRAPGGDFYIRVIRGRFLLTFPLD